MISWLNSEQFGIFSIEFSLDSLGTRWILSIHQFLFILSFNFSVLSLLSKLCLSLSQFLIGDFLLSLLFSLILFFYFLLFKVFFRDMNIKVVSGVWVLINLVLLLGQLFNNLINWIDVSIKIVTNSYSAGWGNKSNKGNGFHFKLL